MKEDKLEVGFSPPQDKNEADDRADAILELIREKGCSFPAEIMGELDISKDTIYRKCRYLEKQGLIKRMALFGVDKVPDWLQPRIKELWARGIKGDKIRYMTWYTVVKSASKADDHVVKTSKKHK